MISFSLGAQSACGETGPGTRIGRGWGGRGGGGMVRPYESQTLHFDLSDTPEHGMGRVDCCWGVTVGRGRVADWLDEGVGQVC